MVGIKIYARRYSVLDFNTHPTHRLDIFIGIHAPVDSPVACKISFSSAFICISSQLWVISRAASNNKTAYQRVSEKRRQHKNVGKCRGESV